MIERVPGHEKKASWFVVSIVTALLVSVSSSSMLEQKIIQPRTFDGTLLELGRYAFIYDAIDHLSEQPDAVVLGIGSSKMREAFDGACWKKKAQPSA